jgi:hypothetical protein
MEPLESQEWNEEKRLRRWNWVWNLISETPTSLQEWRPEGDSHNRLHKRGMFCDSSRVAGQNRRTVGRILSKSTVPEDQETNKGNCSTDCRSAGTKTGDVSNRTE